jgi:hypothetical protein
LPPSNPLPHCDGSLDMPRWESPDGARHQKRPNSPLPQFGDIS